MKSKLKVTILIAVFVVPSVVFVFLKLFGNNQYDIPVLSQPISCFTPVESKILTDASTAGIILMNRQSTPCEDCQEEVDQIKRVFNRYGHLEGLQFVLYSVDSAKLELVKSIPSMNFYQMQQTATTSTCFPVTTNNELLLLDNERRLRGNYKIDREDIDRLMTELEILHGNIN